MKNLGKTDRIIRVIVALVAATLYFTDTLTGIWGIVAMIFAGVFLLTGLVSFCPLYTIFKINTGKGKK